MSGLNAGNAALISRAVLIRQSYGIATSGNTYGRPAGIWLECGKCPVSQVIAGSNSEEWAKVSTEDAARVFVRHGWTGSGPTLRHARCPRCAAMGRWPVEISVPPPAMRGRITIPDPGNEEGELCLRIDGRGETCLGSILYLPDDDLGGCGCHAMRHPPCSYCTSTMPECRRCGYREDE